MNSCLPQISISTPTRSPRAVFSLLFAQLIILCAGMSSVCRADMYLSTLNYSAPGSYSYTVPSTVTRVVIAASGGGGRGEEYEANVSWGSGGPGGYATASYTVSSGQVIQILVGAGIGNESSASIFKSAAMVAGTPTKSTGKGTTALLARGISTLLPAAMLRAPGRRRQAVAVQAGSRAIGEAMDRYQSHCIRRIHRLSRAQRLFSDRLERP